MRPGILPEHGFKHKGNHYASLPWFGTKIAQKYAIKGSKFSGFGRDVKPHVLTFSTSGQPQVTTFCTCAVSSRKKCHASGCRRQAADVCCLRCLLMALERAICVVILCFFASGSATICSNDGECLDDQSCCSDSVCRKTCFFCSVDFDCGAGEECCDDGDCSSDCRTWTGASIAGAVVGTIVFFAIIFSIVACCCCARCPCYRYRSPGTVVTQQAPHQPYVSTTQQVHYNQLPVANYDQNSPANYNQPPSATYSHPPPENYNQPSGVNYNQPPMSNYNQPPPPNYNPAPRRPPPPNYNQSPPPGNDQAPPPYNPDYPR